MVIDSAPSSVGESVFALFGRRARARDVASLVRQLAGCAVMASLVGLAIPSWGPAAAGLGAGACYAGWGLVDRRRRSWIASVSARTLAAVVTLLTVAAAIGFGLMAFTGDGRSPYGTCYDANGRAFACDARGQRR